MRWASAGPAGGRVDVRPQGAGGECWCDARGDNALLGWNRILPSGATRSWDGRSSCTTPLVGLFIEVLQWPGPPPTSAGFRAFLRAPQPAQLRRGLGRRPTGAATREPSSSNWPSTNSVQNCLKFQICPSLGPLIRGAGNTSSSDGFICLPEGFIRLPEVRFCSREVFDVRRRLTPGHAPSSQQHPRTSEQLAREQSTE
jgi:hypothetical protein